MSLSSSPRSGQLHQKACYQGGICIARFFRRARSTPLLHNCNTQSRSEINDVARSRFVQHSGRDAAARKLVAAAASHLDKQATADLPSRSMKPSSSSAIGVFWLLVLNLVLFVADFVFKAPWVTSLYLWHRAPHWWQFLTAAFCHASWDHLSSNLFMLYTFGKIVEEEEGPGALWFTYIVCSVGASAASFFADPAATYSLGASGAVFGLFAVAVLLKLRFNFQKLVECLVLGQFVVKQVLQEVVSAKNGGAMIGASKVGHIAHLAGAVMGVVLILLLTRIPEPKGKQLP